MEPDSVYFALTDRAKPTEVPRLSQPLRLSANTRGWIAVLALIATNLEAQEGGGPPARVTNSVGMAFVLIKPGRVSFGWPISSGYPGALTCPPDDPFTSQNESRDCIEERTPKWFFANWYQGSSFEAPSKRLVSIDYPFYLQETEVTQEQWFRVMKYNTPIKMGHDPKTAPMFPANGYTLTQLEKFVTGLNELEGTDEYRLPSETEWQYACQAGEDEMQSARSIQARVEAVAWFKDNAGDELWPVKQKSPNAWGLYDMIGNVSEYVLDVYAVWGEGGREDNGSPYYPPPSGRGLSLMTRGTSALKGPFAYGFKARDVQTCSARQGADPDNFVAEVGLRVARSTVAGQTKRYGRPFRTDLR